MAQPSNPEPSNDHNDHDVSGTESSGARDRYLAPGWFTRNVFNRVVAGLTRVGVSLAGSRILAVRGRVSGEWRTTVLNPLPLDGVRYLVAPRGTTAWVRNMRAALEGELRRGRRVERFSAAEVVDADKIPVLRAYLERWGWEVGQFFEGIDAKATDEQLAAIAPGFPVFRLTDLA